MIRSKQNRTESGTTPDSFPIRRWMMAPREVDRQTTVAGARDSTADRALRVESRTPIDAGYVRR